MGTTVDKIGNVKELIDTLWNVNSERFILIEGFI